MRTNILRSLLTAVAVVALVNAITLILSPYESPRFLPVIVTALLAEVFMIGGALAFVDRMTERKAPESDADEDTGSPYRSQVQSGNGNVQAGGDIIHGPSGAVSMRVGEFRLEAARLRNANISTAGNWIRVTVGGERVTITHDPKS